MTTILEVSNLKKSYSEGGAVFDILNGISFSIKKAEVVSIIGPSGCGKTSFLQSIGLLDNADGGSMFLEGVDCFALSDFEKTLIRRKSIGFVYQFHCLLPDFTTIENIVLPQLINNISKKEAKLNAEKILDVFGLYDKKDSIISNLSGGEQQRIAVARSMINNPSLILADEPTGNLDHSNSDKVFNLLIDEAKKNHISCIIVTHNIELAKKTDRILILSSGLLKNYSYS